MRTKNRGALVGRSLTLALLLGGAAWAATRSEALGRAEELEARARTPEQRAESIRLALEHLGRRPWSRRAALVAARSLSRLDHPDEAEPYYGRAGRLDLADRHVRAEAILRANRREAAEAALSAILADFPDDPEALRKLGALAFTNRDYATALELADRLAERPGSEVEGHRLAALVHHTNMDAGPAVLAAERVLRLDPELASLPEDARTYFWFRYGQDLVAVGRAEAAARAMEASLARREEPILRAVLGRAAAQLGELDRAEAAFSRVVAEAPSLPVGWVELGRLELLRGRVDQAVDLLRRAEALAPADAELLYSLRTALRRRGDEAEAEAVGRRLEEIRRRQPAPARGMGANVPSNRQE